MHLVHLNTWDCAPFATDPSPYVRKSRQLLRFAETSHQASAKNIIIRDFRAMSNNPLSSGGADVKAPLASHLSDMMYEWSTTGFVNLCTAGTVTYSN